MERSFGRTFERTNEICWWANSVETLSDQPSNDVGPKCLANECRINWKTHCVADLMYARLRVLVYLWVSVCVYISFVTHVICSHKSHIIRTSLCCCFGSREFRQWTANGETDLLPLNLTHELRQFRCQRERVRGYLFGGGGSHSDSGRREWMYKNRKPKTAKVLKKEERVLTNLNRRQNAVGLMTDCYGKNIWTMTEIVFLENNGQPYTSITFQNICEPGYFVEIYDIAVIRERLYIFLA